MATCGKCKANGVGVDHIRACYQVPDRRPAKAVGGPTWHGDEDFPIPEEEAQLILSGLESRENAPEVFLNVPFREKEEAKRLGARWNPDRRQWYFPLGKGNRSDAPEHWLQDSDPSEIGDGFYEIIDTMDDENGEFSLSRVYKVVTSRNRRQYAKVLNAESESWEYAPGAIEELRESGKEVSLERAKELGHLYGVCISCGRRLTNEESIANGIGPICAGKFGFSPEI